MSDKLILNLMYFAAAICITYKMAWLFRMTAHIKGWQILGLRIAGAIVVIVVLSKAGLRFTDPGDGATLIDVGRELSFCLFLFFSIAVLRLRTGRW